MMEKQTGLLNGGSLTVAIVVSRFNSLISDRLLDGAVSTLNRYGVSSDRIRIVEVPGAFEIPLIVKILAEKPSINAIITLGAVIKGETSHYEYVCGEVASGVAKISLDSKMPVIFGVLTTNTLEQALDRAGGKVGNKGSEAAIAAIEMANLILDLKRDKKR